jgi:hypothetical protein
MKMSLGFGRKTLPLKNLTVYWLSISHEVQGALGYNSRTAPRADPKPNPAFFGC